MRKRCHRKHYALVDVVSHAITGAAITDTAALDKLRTRELSAIESFRTGDATSDDWRSLADMLNIAETMAAEGIGREAMPAVHEAQEALSRAHDRFKATGRYGIDGPGLEALRELFAWHDAQRSAIARSAYERLIRLTAARMRTAIAQARADGSIKVLG